MTSRTPTPALTRENVRDIVCRLGEAIVGLETARCRTERAFYGHFVGLQAQYLAELPRAMGRPFSCRHFSNHLVNFRAALLEGVENPEHTPCRPEQVREAHEAVVAYVMDSLPSAAVDRGCRDRALDTSLSGSLLEDRESRFQSAMRDFEEAARAAAFATPTHIASRSERSDILKKLEMARARLTEAADAWLGETGNGGTTND